MTEPTIKLPPLVPPTSDLQTDNATDGRPTLGVAAQSALLSHYG